MGVRTSRTTMAMIEFEDHSEANQRALLQYLDGGAPPRSRWRAREIMALVFVSGTVALGLFTVLR